MNKASGKRPECTVALIISNLEYGGAQRQVVALANELHHQNIQAHIVSLSRYIPLEAEIDNEHVNLHIIEKAHRFDIGVVVRLAALLRKLRVNIVHSFLFDAQIASRLAAPLAGVKIAVGSERNSNYLFKRIQLLALRATKALEHLCVANSEAGRDFSRKALGYDIDHYRVVANGVDIKRFYPRSKEVARSNLGFSVDDQIVGMFASFKPQKNYETFFGAASVILKRTPSALFLIIGEQLHGGAHGSDKYYDTMIELARGLGVLDRCRFLGNRKDVETLYPACDVTVLPSKHEGFPNVVLESLASGVPVVVSDFSDARRLVMEGVVGHVVPIDDVDKLAAAISRLLENQELRSQMGVSSARYAKESYSNEKMAENMADVYRELI